MTKKSGNPVGRPKGSKDKKKAVGRPKEDRGIMEEYRQRMLNSPKSAKVLEVIFNAALDNEHKNQSAAWKLIADRIVPVSGFDKLAGTNTRSSISINITGVDGVAVDGESTIVADQ
jgi:hypothetical protein